VLSDLFKELQRRRVVRVSVAYLIAAWVVLQVSATTFPILQLPDWALRMVLVLVLIGFVVAVALSWAFDITSSGIERTRPQPYSSEEAARAYARVGLPGRPPFLAGRTRYLVAGTVLLVTVLSATGWFAIMADDAGSDALDDGLVAVLPFRVAGADPSLAYLREGMIDLIAAGTPRAVDPRTTLAAMRESIGTGADPTLDDARSIATRLLAGTVLLGSVVGSGERITINATLIRTRDGRELGALPITGPVDSLPALVDRVVAALLSLEAGESQQRLDLLTSTSLPALRAYLEGNAYFRRGEYNRAVEKYNLALDLDSLFVLPALQVADAAGMTFGVPPGTSDRAARVVRASRDRMSPADRAYADARWPVTPSRSAAERIERWEQVVSNQPDRPEAWYHLGDAWFHDGALLGVHDALDRARASFQRAYSLDPNYFVPLQHLIWIADIQGDTAFALREIDRYLQREPDGISAADLQARRAKIRGDATALRQHIEAMDTASTALLLSPLIFLQIQPDYHSAREGIHGAYRALDALAKRAVTAADRSVVALHRYTLAMNAGRPGEALATLANVDVPPGDPYRREQRRIYDAVYWDGDSIAAQSAHDGLQRVLAQMRPGEPLNESMANSLCAVLTWRLWNGNTAGVPASIAQLRASGAERVADQVCAATLEALHAHQVRGANATERLHALDELLRTGPAHMLARSHGNITAARLFGAAGDYERALNASQRVLFNIGGQYYRSTFLELEGRYAAALGRNDVAIAAWSNYLLLRERAEPSRRDRVDQVRRELAALTGEARTP
jgi:tetratricopeptide (TPR) repeat protein